jgi:hypothetical protein
MYSAETITIYQNDSAVRNTADVTGDMPIAILLQSISVVSALNSLVVFYDIHERKVIVYSSVLNTTRNF